MKPNDEVDGETATTTTKASQKEAASAGKANSGKTSKKQHVKDNKQDVLNEDKAPPETSKDKGLAKNGKRKQPQHDWSWEQYSTEWDQHWTEEWGEEWGYEGWNDDGKSWDKAAWNDGKSSLYALPAGQSKKAVGATKQTPETHKKHKALPKKEEEEPPKQVKRKDPPSEIAPKGKAKAKAKAKAAANVKDEKKQPKAPATRNMSQPSVEQLTKEVAKYVKKYHDLGEDYVKQDIKASLKEECLLPENFQECAFNTYWSRASVGLKSRTENKDFGYMVFNGSGSWLLRTAVAIKCASMLAPRMRSI